MSQPDDDPTQTPTTDSAEAKADHAWMVRNWIGIAVISIVGLLLLVIGLMQLTGVLTLFGPVVDSETGQWVAYGVLVIVFLVATTWGWRAIAVSEA